MNQKPMSSEPVFSKKVGLREKLIRMPKSASHLVKQSGFKRKQRPLNGFCPMVWCDYYARRVRTAPPSKGCYEGCPKGASLDKLPLVREYCPPLGAETIRPSDSLTNGPPNYPTTELPNGQIRL